MVSRSSGAVAGAQNLRVAFVIACRVWVSVCSCVVCVCVLWLCVQRRVWVVNDVCACSCICKCSGCVWAPLLQRQSLRVHVFVCVRCLSELCEDAVAPRVCVRVVMRVCVCPLCERVCVFDWRAQTLLLLAAHVAVCACVRVCV
jgi:hypothetical protein